MDEHTLQRLVDRIEATDVVYRYGSSVDRADWVGLRSIFVDDARVRYGNGPVIEGADALVSMLASHATGRIGSHHLLSVYHCDIDGDTAHALCYHTSHLVFDSDPDVARTTVGRYHDRLVRTAEGWKIAQIVMEIVWAGERHDPNGRLAAAGGRGPSSLEI
jgi:hypothetical protein